MKKSFLRLSFSVFIISFVIAGCATTATSPLPAKEKVATPAVIGFPEGYQNWENTFDKSTSPCVPGKDDCFFRVFVNPKALGAYNSENSVYPEGSILVLEVRKSKMQGTAAVVPGDISFIGVMYKYPNDPRSKDTGGWICAKFDGKEQAMPINVNKDCFDCHKAIAKKPRDFICSEGPH